MPVVVVITLRTSATDAVVERARDLVGVFGDRPGFTGGSVAVPVDEEEDRIVVLLRWADLGSWRRALGAPEVKVIATPLLGAVGDEVGSYEVVEEFGPGPDPVRLGR